MSSNSADTCGSSNRDGVGICTGNVNSCDWICGDVTCNHSNFARRQQCKKCKRDRSLERSSSVGSSGSNKRKLGTEIGKAAAEKSRGLFSAEDWQCNKCANVNWARRMTCNMCNAPKFYDVEERTGFGGGYNDRGVVEYKEREESDSEYDEFGRLKKQRKNKERVKNTTKMEKTVLEEEEDEEEDGDDDDDSDLAKYNLFSEDEEIVPSVKYQTNNMNHQNCKADITISSNNKDKFQRRPRSRTRSDYRRRQSKSSSGSSSFSSTASATSSSSSSSSSSSFSDETLSRHLRSRKLQTWAEKRSSRSRTSSPSSLSKQQKLLSHDAYTRKRSYAKSRSISPISSHHSSRSPPGKRKHSPNLNLSRKHSTSPRSNRKISTCSVRPKRRR